MNMQLGDVLICPASGSTIIFTPWYHRLADNARFAYEIIQTVGSPTFAVDVRHRNAEDTSPEGDSAGSSWTTSGNFRLQTVSGLKEMFRFKITLTAGGASTSAIVYRFLEPTWFDQAEGTA